MRRLLVTRREVPGPAVAAYRRAWEEVRTAVEAAGGHAWIFRATAEEGAWLEFVEWQGEGDLPERAALRPALDDLEGFGTGEGGLWTEPEETRLG